MKMGKGGKCRDSTTKIKHALTYRIRVSARRPAALLSGRWRRIPPANSDVLPEELSGAGRFSVDK
jgi:hypothetical protein